MSNQRVFFAPHQKTGLFSQVRSFYCGIVFLLAVILSLLCQAQAQTDQPPGQQPLTGHENHKILLKDAAVLTRNFRNSSGNGENTILGEFFGKDALVAAINQDGCVGLRIYYGKKNDGTPVLVLVGVNAVGNDITDGLVEEMGFLCPPICGGRNPLTEDLFNSSAITELQTPSKPK